MWQDYITRRLEQQSDLIKEDERLIQQYRDDTEKMRSHIEELKTRSVGRDCCLRITHWLADHKENETISASRSATLFLSLSLSLSLSLFLPLSPLSSLLSPLSSLLSPLSSLLSLLSSLSPSLSFHSFFSLHLFLFLPSTHLSASNTLILSSPLPSPSVLILSTPSSICLPHHWCHRVVQEPALMMTPV